MRIPHVALALRGTAWAPLAFMVELNNQIARLEMRSEQLNIHIRSVDRLPKEAGEARAVLFAMLQNLVVLKTRRLASHIGLVEHHQP
jgi:hypothetical protein